MGKDGYPTQAELHAEADQLVLRLGLLELLSRYGHTGIVGSVPLELIVKRDIDIHVVIPEDADPLPVALPVARAILDRGHIAEIRLSDYRSTHGAVKVGLDRVPGGSGDWSVDVWITSRAETAGFQELNRLQSLLTDGQRQVVLELKRHFHAAGRLTGGLSSRIYAAVCDHGVTTPEQFEQWLARQKEDRSG